MFKYVFLCVLIFDKNKFYAVKKGMLVLSSCCLPLICHFTNDRDNSITLNLKKMMKCNMCLQVDRNMSGFKCTIGMNVLQSKR